VRDFDRRRKRSGPPRQIRRVLPDVQIRARLHEAERRVAQSSRRDEATGLDHREQVVEAPLLTARDEEGLRLPVLLQEAGGLDRL
jgi:hypothetical protein